MFSLLLTTLLIASEPDTIRTARVTADRYPGAEQGTASIKVGSAEMERAGAENLSEILTGLPGVNIKDYGGVGGLKTVSLRGFGAQHTGVIIDGISRSDVQNGQTDLGRYDLEDAGEVSVTIGRSSNIFKSARSLSYAGNVELSSAEPVFDGKGFNAGAGISYGSFGTVCPYTKYEQRFSEDWSARASFKYLSSEGDYPFVLTNGGTVTNETRLGSEVAMLNAKAEVYGRVGKEGTLHSSITFYDASRGLPGPVILYTQDPTEHLWEKNFAATAVYSCKLRENAIFQAKGSFVREYDRYTDSSAQYLAPRDDRYLQQEGYLSAVGLWSLWQGVEISLAQDLIYNSLETNFTDNQSPRRFTSLSALSLKYNRGGFSTVGSLLATLTEESVKSGTAAENIRELSPSANINWEITGSLTLRASVQKGFRVPTFNDLYYSKIGNTSLKPERAFQTNIGASYEILGDRLRLRASSDVFYNSVKDKIVATPTMFIWHMRNVGKVRMAGADLAAELNWRTNEWLNLGTRLNYSYLYAVDVTDSQSKSYLNQIAYTPRHCGAARLSAETKWVTLCWNLVAVGERYTLGQNTESSRIGGYLDTSVSVSRTFVTKICNISLSAQALNLADKNYEVIKNYPMPGRNYRAGIKFEF